MSRLVLNPIFNFRFGFLMIRPNPNMYVCVHYKSVTIRNLLDVSKSLWHDSRNREEAPQMCKIGLLFNCKCLQRPERLHFDFKSGTSRMSLSAPYHPYKCCLICGKSVWQTWIYAIAYLILNLCYQILLKFFDTTACVTLRLIFGAVVLFILAGFFYLLERLQNNIEIHKLIIIKSDIY